MSGVRRVGLLPAALIGGAGIAMVTVIVEATPIDLLMNIGAFALLSVTAIAAMGWAALQRQ